MEKSSKGKKKLSVSVEPGVEDTPIYNYFLVKSTENELRIDLAEASETDDEIKINVRESIAISTEKMLEFALDILTEMMDYEEKYKNGRGIPKQPKKKT